MVTFTCDCGKNFNNKQSAKHHLEDSHKEEILDLEVRIMYKSERCIYCYKKIEGPIESHLRPHLSPISLKYIKSVVKIEGVVKISC